MGPRGGPSGASGKASRRGPRGPALQAEGAVCAGASQQGLLGVEGGPGGRGRDVVAPEPAAAVRLVPCPAAGGSSLGTRPPVTRAPHVTHSGQPLCTAATSGRALAHKLVSPQTTYKGKSSFQTYSDYLRWESFLRQQLQSLPEGSALRRGFQTCEHWKQIFMEIIGASPGQRGHRSCPSHSLGVLSHGPESRENRRASAGLLTSRPSVGPLLPGASGHVVWS